jgi:hypothetical protein
MSLSLPQTLSDVRVRAGLTSPVQGSAMTMKDGSLANAPFFLSKKHEKTIRPPREFREFNLYASSSTFMSPVAPS